MPGGGLVGVLNVVSKCGVIGECSGQRGQAQELGEAGEQNNPT